MRGKIERQSIVIIVPNRDGSSFHIVGCLVIEADSALTQQFRRRSLLTPLNQGTYRHFTASTKFEDADDVEAHGTGDGTTASMLIRWKWS